MLTCVWTLITTFFTGKDNKQHEHEFEPRIKNVFEGLICAINLVMRELSDWSKIETTSDKKSIHRYDRTYKFFLSHLIGKSPHVLEIGIQGGDSIDLWHKYFVNAKVVGCDIAPKPAGLDFEYHKLDQSDRQQLHEFAATRERDFDFIIDDGSHCTTHQIQTILELWRCLKPGAVYIIEDIETSYWGNSDIYGYPFNANIADQNVVSSSVDLISSINSEFAITNRCGPLDDISAEIELVSFGHNCIIYIKKDPSYYGEWYNPKKYRYSDRQNQHDWLVRIRRRCEKLLKRFRG
jgi:SAM-dependent methyltransferase